MVCDNYMAYNNYYKKLLINDFIRARTLFMFCQNDSLAFVYCNVKLSFVAALKILAKRIQL